MTVVKMYLLLLLGVDLLVSRADGEGLCSCYTFRTTKQYWRTAKKSCEDNNKTLVAMETEQEWQFITNEIQNKTGNGVNEWFIGLEKAITTKVWTWINDEPLTINKWHTMGTNPDPSDLYGLILKEYPAGFKGSLATTKGNIVRGWICEEETATCRGICFVHPSPTSTSPPETSTGTKAVTTQNKASTEQDIIDVSVLLTGKDSSTTTLPVVTNVSDLNCKNDDDYFTLYLTIAVLAGLLFVVSIILFWVLRLQRKKQQQTDSRNTAVIENQHDFEESFPLNALNIGAQHGLAAGNERNQSEPFVQREGVYAALCSETMTTSEDDGSRTYTSLEKSTREDSDNEYENQISAPEYVNV